jgi:signal transduction histidine kinase
MNESQENIDDLIMESNRLREMIREDQSWYQVKHSCNVIFDSINAGVLILDKEGVCTFINQVAAKWLLLNPDKLIGKNISRVLNEEGTKYYREEILKPVLSYGSEIKSRNSVRLGKKPYVLDYRCTPVRDESGKIIGVLNIAFDVSLEKKRKTYSWIQESINYIGFHTETMEDAIRMIFNLLCQIDCIRSGGIYIFDETRQLLELVHHYNLPDDFVNQVRSYGKDTINYQIVERGMPLYNINSNLSEEQQKVSESLGLNVVAAIPMKHENELIGCLTLAINDSEDFTEEDKTFIESMAWRIARVVALMRSRDKFVNANLELNKTISELREKQQMLIQKSKLESLGELSAGMAHEINQPLMVISLSIENILQRLSAGYKNVSMPYLHKKFESIMHNVNRIQLIIDNMRIFAHEQTSIIFERVKISEVIEKSLSMISAQYRNEGIKLVTGPIDEKLYIIGNFFKLEQVILNLLSNSRYAVNDRGRKNGISSYQKEIEITLTKAGNIAVIQVLDNGIGIPEDHIEKLFTPFFTTKEEGEGTGLGLPIVYGIVKEMNGEIKVDSRVNEFTQIQIILPSI